MEEEAIPETPDIPTFSDTIQGKTREKEKDSGSGEERGERKMSEIEDSTPDGGLSNVTENPASEIPLLIELHFMVAIF